MNAIKRSDGKYLAYTNGRSGLGEFLGRHIGLSEFLRIPASQRKDKWAEMEKERQKQLEALYGFAKPPELLAIPMPQRDWVDAPNDNIHSFYEPADAQQELQDCAAQGWSVELIALDDMERLNSIVRWRKDKGWTKELVDRLLLPVSQIDPRSGEPIVSNNQITEAERSSPELIAFAKKKGARDKAKDTETQTTLRRSGYNGKTLISALFAKRKMAAVQERKVSKEVTSFLSLYGRVLPIVSCSLYGEQASVSSRGRTKLPNLRIELILEITPATGDWRRGGYVHGRFATLTFWPGKIKLTFEAAGTPARRASKTIDPDKPVQVISVLKDSGLQITGHDHAAILTRRKCVA